MNSTFRTCVSNGKLPFKLINFGEERLVDGVKRISL
jgi:hypothetical protein